MMYFLIRNFKLRMKNVMCSKDVVKLEYSSTQNIAHGITNGLELSGNLTN